MSPLGVQDPHYVVLPPGSGTNAFTLSPVNVGYILNNSTSLWIWQNANGQPAGVTRTFRTTFDLTSFDLTCCDASITGTWAADNFLDAILINGASIGPIPNRPDGRNFLSFTPFTINSGFVPGLNNLDFVVRDAGLTAGFRIGSISGTTGQKCPEPSAVLGLGLLGLGAFFKRKLNQKQDRDKA